MELLSGRNLRSEIQASGDLPPLIVAEWFDQIFEGVKAAHRSGVVHRDLKPENVFVTRDAQGRALLNILDFGLAKLRRPEGSLSGSLTAVGTVMGTRAYMSPEQLRGQEVGERTDIFALGVMIVECLIGENPFREKDAAEMTADEVSGAIRIQGESTEIQALNTALGKCLARDPEARFPTVAGAQEALIPLIRDCPPCPVRGGPRPGAETSTV
jgi:serine/threonine-protein kinase